MKVFRDMCLAILVGIAGGMLVSIGSYYYDHRDGGIKQTMEAVSHSFDTIAEVYALGEKENLSVEDSQSLDDVLQVSGNIHGANMEDATKVVLGSLLSHNDYSEDVLVLDDADGNVEDGEPYSGIMRFHIRANSDTREDQELKLAVKEDVVTYLKPLLSNCNNVAESKQTLVSELQNIYKTAMDTIVEQGYDYKVKVYVTEEKFPKRTYNGIEFPAGDYQALRIDIGEAKGQNWWGIMYPPLCFVEDAISVEAEDGQEILKENMTPQEYAELFSESDIQVESKLWNWIFEKE